MMYTDIKVFQIELKGRCFHVSGVSIRVIDR